MLLKKIPDDVIIMIHATSLSYKKKRNIKDTSLRYSTNNIVGIVSFLTRSQGNDNRKKSFDRDKRSIVSKLSETSPTININCRKESAIFSLLEERIWPDSLYIYILSWQFRCRNVDKRPFSGVRWNALSKRHGLFVTSMNLLWFVVRGRISRDGNDSWEGGSGRASGVVPPYRGVTQYSICIRWI